MVHRSSQHMSDILGFVWVGGVGGRATDRIEGDVLYLVGHVTPNVDHTERGGGGGGGVCVCVCVCV